MAVDDNERKRLGIAAAVTSLPVTFLFISPASSGCKCIQGLHITEDFGRDRVEAEPNGLKFPEPSRTRACQMTCSLSNYPTLESEMESARASTSYVSCPMKATTHNGNRFQVPLWRFLEIRDLWGLDWKQLLVHPFCLFQERSFTLVDGKSIDYTLFISDHDHDHSEPPPEKIGEEGDVFLRTKDNHYGSLWGKIGGKWLKWSADLISHPVHPNVVIWVHSETDTVACPRGPGVGWIPRAQVTRLKLTSVSTAQHDPTMAIRRYLQAHGLPIDREIDPELFQVESDQRKIENFGITDIPSPSHAKKRRTLSDALMVELFGYYWFDHRVYCRMCAKHRKACAFHPSSTQTELFRHYTEFHPETYDYIFDLSYKKKLELKRKLNSKV
ncbi:hypothetical protein C8J56DRAFT_1104237 [Mycena floridula]|nr:hypothetical protein C8J56DRAFT_1104237 [Mycena floridula]